MSLSTKFPHQEIWWNYGIFPCVWNRISVSVTEKLAVIYCLKNNVFALTRDIVIIHCLSNSFNNRMFIYKKGWFQSCVLSEMHWLFLKNTRSHLFFLTILYIFPTLKFANIHFNVLSFSVFQNTSHCETNFLSNQLYFQTSIDYTEMRAAIEGASFSQKNFFSEQLVVWSSFFFLVTTFW